MFNDRICSIKKWLNIMKYFKSKILQIPPLETFQILPSLLVSYLKVSRVFEIAWVVKVEKAIEF